MFEVHQSKNDIFDSEWINKCKYKRIRKRKKLLAQVHIKFLVTFFAINHDNNPEL